MGSQMALSSQIILSSLHEIAALAMSPAPRDELDNASIKSAVGRSSNVVGGGESDLGIKFICNLLMICWTKPNPFPHLQVHRV